MTCLETGGQNPKQGALVSCSAVLASSIECNMMVCVFRGLFAFAFLWFSGSSLRLGGVPGDI